MTGNDVTVVVDAQNRTAQAFGSAAKGVKTVGEAADAAGRQLTQMDAKLDRANVQARRLAESEEKAAAKTRDLVGSMVALQREIAENGDESGKLTSKLERLQAAVKVSANATDDYRRAANRASGEAREQARAYDRVAENAREAARAVAMLGATALLAPSGGKGSGGALNVGAGLLGAGAGAAAAGTKVGGAGASALSSVAGSNPYLLAGVVGGGTLAAVGAAPFVGGVAGGAALLGGAAGGAGAGLAGAWMGDPEKYGAQWDEMINRLQQRWRSSSAQFAGPLRDSLKEVDRVLRNLPIERVLDISKSFVGPLVSGMGGGITEAANGFADFLAAAQPVVDTVGPKLVDLGRDVGDAFRLIGSGSEGGAAAMGDLIDGVGYAIVTIGGMIGALEKAYESERDFVTGLYEIGAAMPVTGGLVEAAGESWRGLGAAAAGATEALGYFDQAASETATGVAGLSANLEAMRDQALRMKDAELNLAQGWFDLNKELKDGARTLDLNTEAGIANQRAIEDQVGAAQRAHEQGKLTDAQYAASIERIKAMAKALGYDATQVDNLVDSLAVVPPVTTAGVKTPGMADALRQGESLRGALERIEGDYFANVYVNYHQRGQSLNAPLRTGGIAGAAAGGPQSGLRWVGEEGPEIVRLPTGSTVYPKANANQMMAHGGGSAPVEIMFTSDGGRMADLLVEMIGDAMKAKGGRPELLGVKIK